MEDLEIQYGSVSGQVRGEDGMNLDSFEIIAYAANSPFPMENEVVGELIQSDSGRYQLILPLGSYFLKVVPLGDLSLESPDFLPMFLGADLPLSGPFGNFVELSVLNPELMEVNWNLKQVIEVPLENEGVTVRGKISDPYGSPISGIALEIRQSGSSRLDPPVLLSLADEMGGFSMNLMPGEYDLQVLDPMGVWKSIEENFTLQRPTTLRFWI